jgi:hypothetical protein
MHVLRKNSTLYLKNKKTTHNKYYEHYNAVNPEHAITKSVDKSDIICNFLKCCYGS